jgi:lactate dehydrogenase-like 2-hydroxyacid dehydrogenase
VTSRTFSLSCAALSDTSTIDVDAASTHGVLIARADKSFVASTAELAVGLLLDVARNITVSTLEYSAGRSPAQRPGRQLRGRTAGIIGYGSIGSYLADVLVAMGMNVLVHDPFVTDPRADGMTFVGFDELLRAADVVFPMAPASPETENLIGASELSMMRQGAILINVSRGELLDDAAVAEALGTGHLGGLGLDVGRGGDQRPSPELAAPDASLMRSACDTHVHFYDHRHPVTRGALIRPPDATPAEYRSVQATLGTERVVIVQPTTYGLDNSSQLEAMASFDERASPPTSLRSNGTSNFS